MYLGKTIHAVRLSVSHSIFVDNSCDEGHEIATYHSFFDEGLVGSFKEDCSTFLVI